MLEPLVAPYPGAAWSTQLARAMVLLMLKQSLGEIQVRSSAPGLHEITSHIHSWLADQDISAGLLTLFCAHTSASLLIQENAAPAARSDLEQYFARLAPEDPAAYLHDEEGPDDMPAHLRTALTQTHLSIPVMEGRLAVGTWQGIYLFEHRCMCPPRRITLHMVGE